MPQLPNLANATPEKWDEVITSELQEACVDIHKFREYDSPQSWAKHTLNGKINDWTFSRNSTIYTFWGDVPLATAEIIRAHSYCFEGCLPGQWLPSWSEQPIPSDVHAKLVDYVSWIDENGMFRVEEDDELSAGHKEALQNDANGKLLFVDDPSTDGKPFIQTYTFFTLAALRQFVEICKRHRVEFVYTH